MLNDSKYRFTLYKCDHVGGSNGFEMHRQTNDCDLSILSTPVKNMTKSGKKYDSIYPNLIASLAAAATRSTKRNHNMHGNLKKIIEENFTDM
jgi:hypothetical protein